MYQKLQFTGSKITNDYIYFFKRLFEDLIIAKQVIEKYILRR